MNHGSRQIRPAPFEQSLGWNLRHVFALPLRRRPGVVIFLLVITVITHLVCLAPVRGAEKEDLVKAITRLNESTTGFTFIIENASDKIVEQADERKIKRNAVIWKVRTIEKLKQTLFEDDPYNIIIDQWTLVVQTKQFFQTDAGKKMFGRWQPIALAAYDEIQLHIHNSAKRFFPAKQIPQIHRQLEEWAKRNPIKDALAITDVRPEIVVEPGKKPLIDLNPLLKLSGKPFLTLTGLSKTERDLTQVKLLLAKAAVIAEFLPRQIRWETELMLYDVESRETVEVALAEFQKVSNAFKKLTDTVDGLPEEFRKTLDDTFKQIDKRQGDLQETITQARELTKDTNITIDKSKETLESAEKVAVAFERLTTSVTEAGKAWEATGKAFGELGSDDPPDGTKSEPFKIEDYTRAAESFKGAATEIRALTQELNTLIRDDSLSTTVAVTKQGGIELIDHIWWRALQLVVVICVLAVVYRIFTSRFTRAMEATKTADKKQP